jgi:hypothetical protein
MQVDFELADARTERQFRQLLRENPLAGRINVLLTREPDAFHAAAVSGDVYELMLAYDRETRELLGGGARFELDAYVNGEAMCIGYLGELRVQGGLRQRRRMLLNAYRAMRERHEHGRAPIYITTIISDNVSTRRLLEAGLSDMPTYQPVEELVTLTIPARQAASLRSPRLDVEQCNASDLNELGELVARLDTAGRAHQFHPVWTARTLGSPERCRGNRASDFHVIRHDGGIRGACCLWDQRSFKQTVVAGYSKQLARVRPFFNAVAPLLRQPRLPPKGREIQGAFLSHLSIDDGDEEALLALVRQAARHAIPRGIDYLMLGLAARNPLCKALERRLYCHKYTSMIYVVYWDDGREIASTIDNRIPHPEVAIL